MRARTRIKRWGLRLLACLLVFGALFYMACIGRPQSFDDPLAPAEPMDVPDRAERWPLRIASYNAWILPWFSDEYDERLERIPGALASLSPDLVILQEVWSGGAREQISEAFGPGYAAARCDGGGMMVLTRLPIRSERFTPFRFDCDLPVSEWLAKKGVMEVVIDTPAGPVRVVNTHFALQRGEAEGRTRQLHFLRNLLEERNDMPVILGADLNIGTAHDTAAELDPDYVLLLDTGLRDLNPPVLQAGKFEHGPPTRVGWPRGNSRRRGWRPDHLMVRDGPPAHVRIVSFRLALDTPEAALSDHNLLLGEVLLEARK